MSIKPMLFNSDMVRALVDGRKTVTRRVIKEPYYIDDAEACRVSGLAMRRGTNITHGMPYPDCPYSVGDILWVRETWGDYREHSEDGEGAYFLYRADYPDEAKTYQYPDGPTCDLPKWHPSIHMPKEAARIWLRVTDMRVERLREITIDQILNEGITRAAIEAKLSPGSSCPRWIFHEAAKRCFSEQWDSTIKPADRERYGWAANPWVWVIEFERCEKPKDWPA